MSSRDLDAIDRGILHLLQEDARNNVASTIADEIGVAPNTVRNRIERLEAAGIIEGYYPHINYERAGYQLRVIFVCTAPISRREELANETLNIDGIIEVIEILSGNQNLAVEAVGSDSDDITAIAEQLEELGLEIRDEWFLKNVRPSSFDHFSTGAGED